LTIYCGRLKFPRLNHVDRCFDARNIAELHSNIADRAVWLDCGLQHDCALEFLLTSAFGYFTSVWL